MKRLCCRECGREYTTRNLMSVRPMYAMPGVVMVWRCDCQAYQCRIVQQGIKPR